MAAYTNQAPTFIDSRELDERGHYQRERRRQLEVSGLFPPRVRLSLHRNAWVRTEVTTWEQAKAAGFTDAQLRELVQRMTKARAAAVTLQIVAL